MSNLTFGIETIDIGNTDGLEVKWKIYAQYVQKALFYLFNNDRAIKNASNSRVKDEIHKFCRLFEEEKKEKQSVHCELSFGCRKRIPND